MGKIKNDKFVNRLLLEYEFILEAIYWLSPQVVDRKCKLKMLKDVGRIREHVINNGEIQYSTLNVKKLKKIIKEMDNE